MRILVTGCDGQLGSEIRALSHNNGIFDWFFTDKQALDLADKQSIVNYIANHDISAIINCAAYTNVELAEKEIEAANLINNFAVKNLAEISLIRNIKLIHISTDAVFDGMKCTPYKETDVANPLSVYSKSKLDGENRLLALSPANSVIIRTSWLYSEHGNNFVKTMIKLLNSKDSIGVIYDQIGTPTYARDLAKAIIKIVPLIENQHTEIYHYSNEGVCSWYDFAKDIATFLSSKCKINPIESKEYPSNVTRPHYSVLNKQKIKTVFNLEIPYWRDSLSDCLENIYTNSNRVIA